MRRETKPATLENVRDSILRLAGDVDNLNRTAKVLAARLKVAPEEDSIPLGELNSFVKDIMGDKFLKKTSPDLTSMRDVIEALRWGLDPVHRDIGLIRAHMDAVENGVIPRDAVRRYLKDNKG